MRCVVQGTTCVPFIPVYLQVESTIDKNRDTNLTCVYYKVNIIIISIGKLINVINNNNKL